MRARPRHSLRPPRHVEFEVAHLLRRVARQNDLAPLVPPLRRKLHKRRRRHHRREGGLERLRPIDRPMQRPGHVVPVEDAFLARDQAQNLLGPLPDQGRITRRRRRVEARPLDRPSLPLHLRRMHPDMFGRLDPDPSFGMRPAIDAEIVARKGEPGVGDPLPLLARLAQLHLRRRPVLRQQPFVLAFDHRLVEKTLRPDPTNAHQQMGVVIAIVALPVRGVNREVDRRAIAIGERPGE
jgi:hypothetical protein